MGYNRHINTTQGLNIMAKSEYIVIHNAKVTADCGNSFIVYGRIHDQNLAGKRLLKKFRGEMVKLTTSEIGCQHSATVTHMPVSELNRIRSIINAKRNVMSCAELNLTFTDGVLTMVYAREYTAD